MPAPASLLPYPDLEGLAGEVERIAGGLGAEIVVIGTSVEGRPLTAVRVPGGDRRVLCCANIHGPELVSSRVAVGLLEALASHDPAVTALRARAEVWVLPCLNPDGYVRTHRAHGVGPVRTLRPNARGVDLNRNYPLPVGARHTWLPGGGSASPGAATYRGPAPLSEPETAAVAGLCRDQGFWASVNLHSFMGTLIPPHTPDASQHRAYRDLCRAVQAAQARPYRRLASRIVDGFTGEQEDFQHHVLGIWSLCLETFPITASLSQHVRAPSTFWRFNPRDPEPWVRNDVPGMLAFFRAALDRDRPESAA